MSGINKVILIGRLGKDPELRKTPNGVSVVSFSIATSETWKNSNGEKQEKTQWHNIIVWEKLADLANQYLKKGSQVYIDGKLVNSSWDDKDGNKRYKTEVKADVIQFLGGKKEESAPAQTDNNQQPAYNGGNNQEIIEDDLPF